MARSKPFGSKKHKMSKTDMARIFLSQMDDSDAYVKAQSKVLGGAEGPVRGASTDPSYAGSRIGAGLRGMFGGSEEVSRGAMGEEETFGRFGAMFSAPDPATLYLEGESTDPLTTKTYKRMFARETPSTLGAGQEYIDTQRLMGMAERGGDELFDIEADLERDRAKQLFGQQVSARDRAARLEEYGGAEGPFMPLGGFTAEQELGIEVGLLGGMADTGAQDLFDIEADLESKEYQREKQVYDYSDGRGIGPKMEYGGFTPSEEPGGSGFIGPMPATDEQARAQAQRIQAEQLGRLADRGRAVADEATMAKDETDMKTRWSFIRTEYSELGTKIRAAESEKEKMQLIHKRNELIGEGQRLVQDLGIGDKIQSGTFPYVKTVKEGDLAKAVSEQQQKGLEKGLAKSMGAGMGAVGLKRGELFKGTGYATTGAINGVMKALAGIFILFVFIGVFYMVFGPIYDTLIFNFTNIVSADGDPTLGGKDIPTLFDNVAKVILVWVPLIVFAGALYKLTALVFEREGGTRSTEETEWDMLASIEGSTDLDMGSEPGVFEAYGGGY